MMVDSVSQTTNTIQSSTRISEERKMFVELMKKLSAIPRFFVEEVDAIYNSLASNPTMITSFLSKLADSKERWMQKQLEK